MAGKPELWEVEVAGKLRIQVQVAYIMMPKLQMKI